MAVIVFTSSDSFMQSDANAEETAVIEIQEYIEGTYELLRHGARRSEGIVFARFINGAWQLEDGRRFSDWAVPV